MSAVLARPTLGQLHGSEAGLARRFDHLRHAASGGRWTPVTTGDTYDDKPRWSPDGRVLYFLSARDGTLNLSDRRFDPASGTPAGGPFRVTAFRATGPALPRDLGRMEIAIAANRLFVPITEASGTIWMLEGMQRQAR